MNRSEIKRPMHRVCREVHEYDAECGHVDIEADLEDRLLDGMVEYEPITRPHVPTCGCIGVELPPRDTRQ